jgi:hypothetical protein
MFRTFVPLIVAFCVSGTALHGQEFRSVVNEGGNIFGTTVSGQRVQLTTLGLDADPALSPDGQWFAFVRRTPDT